MFTSVGFFEDVEKVYTLLATNRTQGLEDLISVRTRCEPSAAIDEANTPTKAKNALDDDLEETPEKVPMADDDQCSLKRRWEMDGEEGVQAMNVMKATIAT